MLVEVSRKNNFQFSKFTSWSLWWFNYIANLEFSCWSRRDAMIHCFWILIIELFAIAKYEVIISIQIIEVLIIELAHFHEPIVLIFLWYQRRLFNDIIHLLILIKSSNISRRNFVNRHWTYSFCENLHHCYNKKAVNFLNACSETAIPNFIQRCTLEIYWILIRIKRYDICFMCKVTHKEANIFVLFRLVLSTYPLVEFNLKI